MYVKIPKSVSLTTPAIQLWAAINQRKGATYSLAILNGTYPVVAIRSTVCQCWFKEQKNHDEPRYPTAPDAAELLADGWAYDGTEVIDDYLILLPDQGPCPLSKLGKAYDVVIGVGPLTPDGELDIE